MARIIIDAAAEQKEEGRERRVYRSLKEWIRGREGGREVTFGRWRARAAYYSELGTQEIGQKKRKKLPRFVRGG